MRNEIRRLISIGASDSRFRGGGELDLTFFRDKSITARRGIRFSLDRVGKTLDWRGGGASVATLTKRNFRSRCALNRILLVHYANEYKID